MKHFDVRGKEELDLAINEKIQMINQVYAEGLKKKEEEEAREKQRILQQELEKEKQKETVQSSGEKVKSSVPPMVKTYWVVSEYKRKLIHKEFRLGEVKVFLWTLKR